MTVKINQKIVVKVPNTEKYNPVAFIGRVVVGNIIELIIRIRVRKIGRLKVSTSFIDPSLNCLLNKGLAITLIIRSISQAKRIAIRIMINP